MSQANIDVHTIASGKRVQICEKPRKVWVGKIKGKPLIIRLKASETAERKIL